MSKSAFLSHLATGSTTVCHAWAVIRRDGLRLGFTDHDQSFSFDGIEFRADTGMTARALQQSTGLSVDNTEAMGMLSDAAIAENAREIYLQAGRSHAMPPGNVTGITEGERALLAAWFEDARR